MKQVQQLTKKIAELEREKTSADEGIKTIVIELGDTLRVMDLTTYPATVRDLHPGDQDYEHYAQPNNDNDYHDD